MPGARAVKVVTTAVLGLGPCLAECYIISTVIIINIDNSDHVVYTPTAEYMTWGHQCSVVKRCGAVPEGAVMCDSSVTSAVSFCVERCDVLEAINSSRSQLFIVLTSRTNCSIPAGK